MDAETIEQRRDKLASAAESRMVIKQPLARNKRRATADPETKSTKKAMGSAFCYAAPCHITTAP